MLGKFSDKSDFRSSNTDDSRMNFYVVIKQYVTCIAFTDKQVTKSQAYGMCNEIVDQFSQRYAPGTLAYA